MGRQRGTRNTDTPAASHPHRHHQRQPTRRRHHLRRKPHTHNQHNRLATSHHHSNRQTDQITPASRPRFKPRGISQAQARCHTRGPEFRYQRSASTVRDVCVSACVAAPASCIRVHTHAGLCNRDAAVTSSDRLHSYCFTAVTCTALRQYRREVHTPRRHLRDNARNTVTASDPVIALHDTVSSTQRTRRQHRNTSPQPRQ